MRRAIAGLLGALLMTAGAVDAATVQMFTELITATEGQTVAVRVTRLGTAAGPVTVDWSIADDLVAGVDYGGPTSGTLSWTATDLTPRVISIPLIENAVQHAVEQVTITVGDSPRAVGITISDDGPGLPSDGGDPELLFAAGARAADSTGAGLGLALARRVARTLGGDVTVTSERNPTSFTLTLPRP